MRSIFAIFFFGCFIFTGKGQTVKTSSNEPDATKKIQVLEVSCGKCKFSLPGKSCALAVRIDGKAYYVDGAGIDDFGDAHEHDGMCNAIRKAEVQGEIVDDRFKVTYIKLLPEPKNEEKKN